MFDRRLFEMKGKILLDLSQQFEAFIVTQHIV